MNHENKCSAVYVTVTYFHCSWNVQNILNYENADIAANRTFFYSYQKADQPKLLKFDNHWNTGTCKTDTVGYTFSFHFIHRPQITQKIKKLFLLTKGNNILIYASCIIIQEVFGAQHKASDNIQTSKILPSNIM